MRLRPLTPACILSLALLAGAGLGVPAAAAAPEESRSSDSTELVLPMPDPATVRAARESLGDGALGHDRESADLLTGGSAALASVAPWVKRIAGSDRYATAAATAMEWSYVWDGGDPSLEGLPRIVVVASGERFPDALSGGALAGNLLAPVLLTRQGALPAATASALRELRPDLVVLLGGTGAVSSQVERSLQALVPTPQDVLRIGGADRYEVSATIAALIGGDSRRLYVVSGENFPDGLSGGALAGSTFAPMVLTRKGAVPPVVLEVVEALAPAQITVIGGTGSVSNDVTAALADVAPVTRIAGADRYETAAKVAAAHDYTHEATMASGLTFPDALAGSAYAVMAGGPVLLLRPSGVPAATREAVLGLTIVMITVLGGTASVPEPVLTELRALRVQP